MLRSKPTSKKDSLIARNWATEEKVQRFMQEQILFDFLDRFDFHSFLYDTSYRRRLNDLLEGFSEEEFNHFEQLYFHRFIVN